MGFRSALLPSFLLAILGQSLFFASTAGKTLDRWGTTCIMSSRAPFFSLPSDLPFLPTI